MAKGSGLYESITGVRWRRRLAAQMALVGGANGVGWRHKWRWLAAQMALVGGTKWRWLAARNRVGCITGVLGSAALGIQAAWRCRRSVRCCGTPGPAGASQHFDANQCHFTTNQRTVTANQRHLTANQRNGNEAHSESGYFTRIDDEEEGQDEERR